MKKKYVIILLIIMFGLGISVDKLLFNNNETLEDKVDIPKTTHKNMLSMMLETESESGEYKLETRSSWPTKEDGYIFNSTLSKCEKGSKLSWDDENNAVVMEASMSDKCYVYFDVYVEPKVLLANYVKSLYTGIQGENGIYYHNGTILGEDGTVMDAEDNSYRYAGSSDTTNNFVCFGSDDATCPEDNLYRIIGVFDNKVKLIKATYASSDLLGTDGTYDGRFDEYSYYYSIARSIGDGLVNVNLNTNFINYLNLINIKWSNYIDNNNWYNYANTWEYITNSNAKIAYNNEFLYKDSTFEAKIGLMYVSDYYYASPKNYWVLSGGYSNDGIGNYSICLGNDYSESKDENWLFLGNGEWTIISSRSGVYSIYYKGCIVPQPASDSLNFVRPVFYLNNNVTLTNPNSTGSQTDPYRID